MTIRIGSRRTFLAVAAVTGCPDLAIADGGISALGGMLPVFIVLDANLRSEQERALYESSNIDVVDLKPNFFGLGANLNEAWRRLKRWRSK